MSSKNHFEIKGYYFRYHLLCARLNADKLSNRPLGTKQIQACAPPLLVKDDIDNDAVEI